MAAKRFIVTILDEDAGYEAGSPPEASDSQERPEAPKLPLIKKPREDRVRANRVRELFQRARSARQPMTDQWVKNYELCHNRTWSSARASHLPSPSPASQARRRTGSESTA